MKSYTLAVIEGDGIGPEIVRESVKVLDIVGERFGISFDYKPCLMGGCAIDATGVPLPRETIDICKASDSVLLGAVGGEKWDTLPGHLRPEAGLLGIRGALGLYANLRPARIFAPLKTASPIKESIIGDGLDIMVVRELTGGIYFGERGRKEINGAAAAYDTEMYTVPEIERICRVGFEMAQKRRKKLCSVDKANVLESSRLWRETVTRLATDYPDVTLSYMYVDNCAMQLVRNPRQFDVIVTSNIFGDILSDEASMISGSIGMLASASLGQGSFGLYEPIHGSAPDIAGQGVANPLATILSVAMLLQYSLNEQEAAAAIERAVNDVLCELRTADIFEEGYQKVGTAAMGDAVCARIKPAKSA
ncbi:MAG: 3-isopropylmalate dehydrogenase [Oscillospiraceae bacterium]|jgi:3-isopropylmalate dehydrogenase|nr:3-isopropylmalate dehydrogenase [Oscillospiraceae bacterium]